jgi:cytochrome c peroxidase
MFKFKLFCISGILGGVTFMSCSKDPAVSQLSDEQKLLQQFFNLPSEPFNYASPNLPEHLKSGFVNAQKNTPAGNPVTNWGATLGRVLFYDKSLSSNGSISCASCHIQAFGFTDTAQFSKGVNGLTKRHSMSLINSAYYANGRFFWDERAARLEHQVLMPIQDKVEMNMTLDSVLTRLRSTSYYPILFKYAFGSDSVSSYRISLALAQFVRSIVSSQSKYDDGRKLVSGPNVDFPNFTSSENLGKQIFFGNRLINCSGCHLTDMMVLDNPRNNGLFETELDSGIFVHTGNSQDIGKFKAPSLRNIGLRHRFMHDGHLIGLNAVIEHYDNGIQSSPHLDTHLKDPVTGIPYKMGLSPAEKQALLDFLNTLTDEHIITDAKFSNPWLK